MIKQERISHFGGRINYSVNKSKTMCEIVNRLRNKIKRPKKILLTDDDHCIISGPVKVANSFGTFLSSTVKDNINVQFGQHQLTCTLPMAHERSMLFLPVVADKTVSLVRGLPNKKSVSFDEVPVAAVKACVDMVSPVLEYVPYNWTVPG